MKTYGYESCYAMPVITGSGDASGVFAIYRHEPVEPTPEERDLIDRCAKIAGIAIDRARVYDALQTSEMDLRRANAQLSEGQRLSKTGSFTSDIHRDKHIWSDEYYRIFEIDPAASPNLQAVRDRVHPDDLDLFEHEIQRAVAGSAADFTFRVVTPVGGVKHLRGVARVVEHVGGRPIFMGTVQDITQNKLGEDALAASERALKTIIDTIPAMVWSARPDGAADFFNQHYLDFVGISPDRLQGWGWVATVHPEDVDRLTRIWAALLASGEAGEAEVRLRRFDGAYRWFLIRATPLRDEIGRIIKWSGVNTDIEQRKQAEQELRRSEAFLAQGQRLTMTGSLWWNASTGELSWSDESYRMMEYPRSVTPSAELILARCHPEDRAMVMGVIAKAATEKGHFEYEHRLVMPGGSIKYVHVLMEYAGHATGQPEFIGAVSDITERERVARELVRASRELNEAQRLSKTGSFTWDFQSDQLMWSDEIRRIFGFDPGSEVTLQMIQAAVHPGDMAEVERAIGGALEGLDFDLVFRIIRHEGEIRYVHVRAHRIPHVADRPVFLGALQDVTESKIAEDALKANEAELRRANSYLTIAQKISKTGSFIWDVELDLRTWSEEMYQSFEVKPGSPIPRNAVEQHVHPDDVSIVQDLIQRGREGRNFEGEFRLVMRSGSVKNVHVLGQRISGDSERLTFVAAMRDVTDLKRGEDALNRARAELAHLTRVATLNALTASIAHEVNQPLAGIITNASTCLRMLDGDVPNLEGARATVQRTLRDADRASEVIRRLRTMFARKTLISETVDLDAVAREVLALLSSELQRVRVVVRTSFETSLPPVPGDRVQLQQVIMNLILNAADAMRGVEGRPHDLLVVTARGSGDRVRLSVRDSGVGIAPESFVKLFEAFYTTKSDGMGVGLSISRSIIESHGGQLWASVNEGPGATFSFWIPGSVEPPEGQEPRIRK